MVNARDSHGNAYGVFISPAGWWTLAGGNTPGNSPDMLRPGGALESSVIYPIRPISRIRPIPPHPKSTVELGHEPLIRVENGLRPPFSPACYRPLIRPENKGIKPKSSRHKPKFFITGRYALCVVVGECGRQNHERLFIRILSVHPVKASPT